MDDTNIFTLEDVPVYLDFDIEYSYTDWDGEPNETDKDEIQRMITDGYNQGQLCTYSNEDDYHVGWWKIVGKDRDF